MNTTIVCSLNQINEKKCINVGGIKTKLKGADFEQYIEQFDLVCLGETKLDRFDDIVIPGYKCYMLNRTVCKVKSGGIALLVKESLLAFVKPLESSSECVFWFVIDEQLADKNLLLGIVYIPPESSPYSSVSILMILN